MFKWHIAKLVPFNGLRGFFSWGGGWGEETFLLNIAITRRSGGKSLQELTHWKLNDRFQINNAAQHASGYLNLLWLWNRFSSRAIRAGASPQASLHFSYLWWFGLEPQQPEAFSQHLLSAAPGSAPRSSPGDAGHQPKPTSAAGFHPPEAAASAPGGRPGPPCPCYCWLTRHRLEFRQCHKKEKKKGDKKNK